MTHAMQMQPSRLWACRAAMERIACRAAIPRLWLDGVSHSPLAVWTAFVVSFGSWERKPACAFALSVSHRESGAGLGDEIHRPRRDDASVEKRQASPASLPSLPLSPVPNGWHRLPRRAQAPDGDA